DLILLRCEPSHRAKDERIPGNALTISQVCALSVTHGREPRRVDAVIDDTGSLRVPMDVRGPLLSLPFAAEHDAIQPAQERPIELHAPSLLRRRGARVEQS